MIHLLKTQWRLILFGFLLTFFSAPGQTFFISLFSVELRQELGLSHGQFGAYYSIGTLLSAAVVIWSGALIDRIDLRVFSGVIALGLACACFLLSITSSVWMLILSLFLLRHFGQGLMFLTASTSVVRYIDAAKGKANGISGMGYSLSEMILPSLIVLGLSALSWRESWRVVALFMAFVALPLLLFLLKGHSKRHQKYLVNLDRQSTAVNETKSRRQWRRGEVLKDWKLYVFIPNTMAPTLLFTGFIFHQRHLVETKGWLLENWTLYFIAYGAVAMVAKLISGWLVDRYSATALLPLHTIPLLLGMLLLATMNAAWVALGFLLLMAITSGMQSTITTPFLAENYGNQYLGSIKSVVSALMVFVSSLSPAAMGWMIDIGISLETQALLGALITALTIVMAFIGYQKCKGDVL